MKFILLLVLFLFAENIFAQEKEETVSPVLRAQILLDRAHFSVGEIDGVMGTTTENAIRMYQEDFRQEDFQLPVAGKLDSITDQMLEDNEPLLKTYVLTAKDIAGPFGPAPMYANKMEKLGEVFQSSPNLLRKLNPHASFDEGETLTVPNIGGHLPDKISKIVVTKSQETFKVYNTDGNLMGVYPTTLGKDQDVPFGTWHIVGTSHNPYYRRVLPTGKIRAMTGGPNNYVGDIWMSLSAKHYGIHGSPMPDKIAKQQSAGCIRLTNWDAHEVAASITKHTVVVVQP